MSKAFSEQEMVKDLSSVVFFLFYFPSTLPPYFLIWAINFSKILTPLFKLRIPVKKKGM